MKYAELLLPEFNEEMANTRKVLEIVPEDKLNWRAHPKLNTIGWNASHLAEIPGWVEGTLTQPNWDFSPPGSDPYRTEVFGSIQQLLSAFDQNVASARRAIEGVRDEDMGVDWSLLYQGNVVFTMPRTTVIRSFVMNHLIHHRAHLIVYLRLNDIAVPGMYGPTGD